MKMIFAVGSVFLIYLPIAAIGEGQFSQFETLGVNELRDEYTLRVFDAFTKARYESRTFTMHEVQPDGQPGQ